jgi:hypothetical protein
VYQPCQVVTDPRLGVESSPLLPRDTADR